MAIIGGGVVQLVHTSLEHQQLGGEQSINTIY